MAFERLGGWFSGLKERFGEDKVYEGDTPPIAEPVRQPSDYDAMINEFGGHWGQTQEGLEDIMGKVSHHESKGKNVYQTGGGPGAGLFQYETGAGQGGMTARNRLSQWYSSQGKDAPDWLNQEDMENQGFDATKLNEEQQKMLFMADKRYHPTASLSPEATQDTGEWWAQNHWAGGEKGSDIYNTRVASFNRDLADNQPVDDVMANYQKSNLDNYLS